jgi:hypothetical protein
MVLWHLRNWPAKHARALATLGGLIAYLGLSSALEFSTGLAAASQLAWLRLCLGIVFGAGLVVLALGSELGRWIWHPPIPPWSIHICNVLLILWLGLLPLFWFAGNHSVIAGSDLWFPLKPADFLARAVFTWDDRVFAGYANFLRLPQIFPYYLLVGGLDQLELPLSAIEGVWFVILFTAPGLAMYACAASLARHRSVAIVPLFAALIYMLSPITVKEWAAGHQLFSLARAGWAGLIWLVVRLRAGGLSPFRFALGAGLISLVMAPVMSNPALALVIGGSVGGLAIGLAIRAQGWSKVIQAYGLALLLTFLLNLWWILPSAIQYRSSPLSETLSLSSPSVLDDAEDSSKYSALSNVLRLTGYSGFWDGVQGEPYILFASVYLHWLDVLSPIAFLVPVLAIVGILVAARDQLALVLAVQLVLSLALAHGLHSPGSYVFAWLYEHTPASLLFRDAFSKFAPIASGCYALLAAIGLGALGTTSAGLGEPTVASGAGREISGRLRPLLKRFILLLGVSWIVLVSWPLFTGDVIRRGGHVLADHRVTIPSDYQNVLEALRSRGVQGRIFLTPASGVYVQYTWGYQGPEITTLLWPYAQLFANDGESPAATSRMIHLASELLRRGDAPDELHRVLSLLNVQYILQRDDLDWTLYGTDPPAHMDSVLNQPGILSHVADLGRLRLYTVQSDTGWPLVYAAGGPSVRPPETDPLGAALRSPAAGPTCPGVLVADSNANATVLDFTRVNPTRYYFEITSTASFWLVFKQSFDEHWQAYAYVNEPRNSSRDQAWYRGSALLTWLFERNQRTEIAQHCLANGYANGWQVPGSGQYTISLEYTPQRYFELGILVSAMALLACGSYLVISIGRRAWASRPTLSP